MEDWQTTQFSNRHVHNRVGKHSRGIKGKANAAFDVHRTFGSYEVKCPAAAKLAKSEKPEGLFEVYCLSEKRDALVGRLVLPGVLDAGVLLAGSRKSMGRVVEGLIAGGQEEVLDVDEDGEPGQGGEISSEANGGDEEVDDGGGEDDEDEEDEDDDEESEDEEPSTHDNFEKNSFRLPKFWVRWQGHVRTPEDDNQDSTKLSEGTGYFIFAGNDCKKFQGTLSIAELGFDNVKITGWRIAGKPERDFDIEWRRLE